MRWVGRGSLAQPGFGSLSTGMVGICFSFEILHVAFTGSECYITGVVIFCPLYHSSGSPEEWIFVNNTAESFARKRLRQYVEHHSTLAGN